MEHTAYKERLTNMGLFILEKRRCRGNLTVIYSYLKGKFSQSCTTTGCKSVNTSWNRKASD